MIVLDEVTKGEAERLATRLEAEDRSRPENFRYALVDRDLLRSAIKFLRATQTAGVRDV